MNNKEKNELLEELRMPSISKPRMRVQVRILKIEERFNL